MIIDTSTLTTFFSLFFRKQVRQWVEEAAGGQAKQFAAVVSKGTDGKIFGSKKMEGRNALLITLPKTNIAPKNDGFQ